MRKLLLSLSSLAIAATTAMTVVACDTTNTSEFISWANSTRATENNKSSTMVVYIGSENNASSKSFEKAMTMITGTDDIYKAFDFINNYQDDTNNNYNNVLRQLKTIDKNFTPFQSAVQPTKEVNVEKNKEGKWVGKGWSENKTDLFNGDEAHHDTSKFSFKAIKVSNVEALWTEDDAMTYSILNDYIIPSMAKTLYSYFYTVSNNTVNEPINAKIEEMVGKIKKLKGPLFLTITDGQIISITNGFQVEAQFAANPAGPNSNADHWDHGDDGVKQLNNAVQHFITTSIGAGSTSFKVSDESTYNIVHDSGWDERSENGKEVEKRSSLSYSIDHNKYN